MLAQADLKFFTHQTHDLQGSNVRPRTQNLNIENPMTLCKHGIITHFRKANLNIVPMQAMSYKYNITHSFDVTSGVCYKTLIPWLSMLYYIYNT